MTDVLDDEGLVEPQDLNDAFATSTVKVLGKAPFTDKVKSIFDRSQDGGGYELESKPSNITLIDVSDLVYYIGHHDNLTGIQRVQASLILGLKNSPTHTFHFVSWSPSKLTFFVYDSDYLQRLLSDLSKSAGDRKIKFPSADARVGILPGGTPLSPNAFHGAKVAILLLGAAWVIPDYWNQIQRLRRDLLATFACVIHDLIPVYARETCDQGTADVFRLFMDAAEKYIDLFICVSENTRNDLLRYFSEQGWEEPNALVITHASEMPQDLGRKPVVSRAKASYPNGFVLFVSTIEGRKNHKLAFAVWVRLLRELGPNAPSLICVGRPGWRAEDFLNSFVQSEGLGGKIEIRSEISDAELDELYESCLFTLYPSLYEGWGLPISESLGKGKLCVCSNTSSMPEAGEDFAIYIDPLDVDAAYRAIHDLIVDPEQRAEREAFLKENYVVVPWSDVAEHYSAAMVALANLAPKNLYSTLVPGQHFVLRELPRSFDGKLGNDLLDAINASLRSQLTGRPCSRASFYEGSNLRDGGAWFVPEEWGCWLGLEGGDLAFNWPRANSLKMIFVITFRVLDPFASAAITYRTRSDSVTKPASLNGRHMFQITVSPGLNLIHISIAHDAGTAAASYAIDGRGLMLGVSEVLIIEKEDIQARMTLLETLTGG